MRSILVPFKFKHYIIIACVLLQCWLIECQENSTEIINNGTFPYPLTPPETVPQAFETTHYDPMRNVTIYWKEFPLSYDYTIDYESFNYFVQCINLDNQTDPVQFRITKNIRATFSLGSAQYEFRVFSQYATQMSENYSRIFLPSTEMMIENGPKSINVYMNDDENYELEWEVKPEMYTNFESFTVFWCSPKISDSCIDDLNWDTTKKSKILIEFERSHQKPDFKFGVSVNTVNSSSGIFWAKCYAQLPIDSLYHLDAFPQGPTRILVKWVFSCPAQTKMISHYEMHYCPVDNCTEMDIEVTDNKDWSNRYMLENLTPNTKYKIIFQATGLWKGEDTSATTDLGIPERPQNVQISYLFPDNMPIIYWNYLEDYVDGFFVEIYDKGRNSLLDKLYLKVSNCEQGECFYNVTLYSKYKTKLFNPYSNYIIRVSACNSKPTCSYGATIQNFRSLPGKPGKMLNPPIEKVNDTAYRIFFQKPTNQNGPIDQFYVLQENSQECTEEITGDNSALKNCEKRNITEKHQFSGKDPSAVIEVNCTVRDNFRENSTYETFRISISASNYVDYNQFVGYSHDFRFRQNMHFDVVEYFIAEHLKNYEVQKLLNGGFGLEDEHDNFTFPSIPVEMLPIQELLSEPSDPTSIDLCNMPKNFAMQILVPEQSKSDLLPNILVSIIIVSSLIFVISIYFTIRCFRNYRAQKKSFVIKVQCNENDGGQLGGVIDGSNHPENVAQLSVLRIETRYSNITHNTVNPLYFNQVLSTSHEHLNRIDEEEMETEFCEIAHDDFSESFHNLFQENSDIFEDENEQPLYRNYSNNIQNGEEENELNSRKLLFRSFSVNIYANNPGYRNTEFGENSHNNVSRSLSENSPIYQNHSNFKNHHYQNFKPKNISTSNIYQNFPIPENDEGSYEPSNLNQSNSCTISMNDFPTSEPMIDYRQNYQNVPASPTFPYDRKSRSSSQTSGYDGSYLSLPPTPSHTTVTPQHSFFSNDNLLLRTKSKNYVSRNIVDYCKNLKHYSLDSGTEDEFSKLRNSSMSSEDYYSDCNNLTFHSDKNLSPVEWDKFVTNFFDIQSYDIEEEVQYKTVENDNLANNFTKQKLKREKSRMKYENNNPQSKRFVEAFVVDI